MQYAATRLEWVGIALEATTRQMLTRHGDALERLVSIAQADPRLRWLSLGCSVAEGRADALSDLDLGLGVTPDSWPAILEDLPVLLSDLGEVVDVLAHRIPEWGDSPHQRIFVQYADGLQVDLVAFPARSRGRPPNTIALYDPDGYLAEESIPAVIRADAEAVREWAFLGWVALCDLAKYLERGSLWEALERLHAARTQVFRLWAALHDVPYPLFGLTGLLDHPEAGLPLDIDETVAALDPADLLRSARACADLLGEITRALEARSGVEAPTQLETYVRDRITRLEGR